jgi:hypothetical protein
VGTWLGCGFAVAGLSMVPWLVFLADTLPRVAQAAHWPAAWVGLDGLEAIGLLTTGLALIRRSSWVCLPAAITATLLVVDAWFDITTSASGSAVTTAVAMAVFSELPAAVLCAVLAVRTAPRSAPRESSRRPSGQSRRVFRSLPPASAGGEGSLTDGRRVVKRLPRDLVAEFTERKLRYIHVIDIQQRLRAQLAASFRNGESSDSEGMDS